jgi:ornithine carbamoyltransferase
VTAGRRSFLSILDWDPATLEGWLSLAQSLKRERGQRRPAAGTLEGQHVALLFEKPSLRTRATFEVAVHELGGWVIEPRSEAAFGQRESEADVARNLERWVSGVVIRTFSQDALRTFVAAAPGLTVVNALTDQEHPCQALADLQTLVERWADVQGRTVAFVGDGNNVATSLAHVSAMMGIHVRVASPSGYRLPDRVAEDAARVARFGARLQVLEDPFEAVRGADAVYTDTWTSMGQEDERIARRATFLPYQVNRALMAGAAPGALFMHCLPAHRGEEVTDEVVDGPNSVVFDQAENRLHAQKALLLMLMGR